MFCEEMAEKLVYARNLAGDFPEQESEVGPRPGALEKLFFNEILESAPWTTIMQAACGGEGIPKEHINVTEIRATMKTIRKRAIRGYGQRQLYGLDSQVGLGVCSKGRSPSYVLNEEAREGTADIIGLRHYPGYCFSPTRLNPADYPSRFRRIRRNRQMPGFLAAAAAGDYGAFDRWAALPLQPRAAANWARFWIRLAYPESLEPWAW